MLNHSSLYKLLIDNTNISVEEVASQVVDYLDNNYISKTNK